MPPADAARADSARITPRWLIAIAAVLLGVRLGLGLYGLRELPRELPREERVAWLTPEEGAERARRQVRPILYAFVDEQDPISRTMREELFEEQRAAEAIERVVVPVKVTGRDTTGSDTGARLRRQFAVRLLPTLIVVPPGEEPLRFEGYPGPGQTLQWIATSATTHGFSFPRPFPPDSLPR
jgi:hypothetical protein